MDGKCLRQALSAGKRLSLIFVVIFAAFHSLISEAAEFAWQSTNTYRPPDFEVTFPIDAESGAHLDLLFKGQGPGDRAGENIFELFRRGLRTSTVYPQMLFSWLGNTFIWNKSPQNPKAIELAYHAAGSTNQEISHTAIYFGLSTVRPMSEPILHALVDIGMRSEDPNVLSRIAWGGAAQRDRLLFYLKPYLESNDPKVREYAETVQRIFSGELEAFDWAAGQAKKKAEAKYANRLEEFRTALEKGDSAKRRETLDLVQRERIDLIMDESFLRAFGSAAEDPDSKVRNSVTTIAGQRWVWSSPTQSPEAIDLMTRLSRDADRDVRRGANYYGLSTIRNRTDAVVERMIEMAMHDGFHERNFRERITWGLNNDHDRVRSVLKKWMDDFKVSILKAGFAYGFYLDFFAQKPEVKAEFEQLIQENEKPVARVLAFAPTQGYKPKDMDEYFATLRQEVPAAYASPIRWISGEMPILIVEEREVPAIEKAMATSPHFKKMIDRVLPLQQLIEWGKEGEFRDLR